MKIKFSIMASYLLGLGLILAGCTSIDSVHEGSFSGVPSTDSVDYHLVLIQNHEARSAMLEEKIQRVEARIISHNRKPSRDRRGVKRKGWKRLIGEWQQEIKRLQEQIMWHRIEAKRLQSLTLELGSSREAGDEIQEEKYNSMGFL